MARGARPCAHAGVGVRRSLAAAVGATAGGALLSGCGTTAASGGGSLPGVLWWGVTGLAVVVFAVLTGVLTKRRTARPLVREQRSRERERAALTAERDVLLRERDGFRRERAEREQQLRATSSDLETLAVERDRLLADLEALAAERDAATAERDQLVTERDELLGSVDATFVNLAMRTLTLVERQLVLIESLEGQEADPDQLENLFRLDHLATRMRRNSENMLLLAGLENSRRGKDTVPLLDVVRAAVSEIERYERVKLGFLPYALLAGSAADDTSHLLAELLENATAFSPPQDKVEVGAWRLDNGELMLSVTDRGIGMPAERLREFNEQLAAPEEPGGGRRNADEWLGRALTGRSMGLFVVARLARRHGVRVQLRENAQGGGVTAMVVLPREVLRDDPGGAVPADLDEQRQAEREVAAAAETSADSRAALDFPVEPPVAPATPVVPAAARPVLDDPAAGGGGELPDLPRRTPAGPGGGPEPAVGTGSGARRGRHHRPAEPVPEARSETRPEPRPDQWPEPRPDQWAGSERPSARRPEPAEAAGGEARHARPGFAPGGAGADSTIELVRRRPGASGAAAQMPHLPPVAAQAVAQQESGQSGQSGPQPPQPPQPPQESAGVPNARAEAAGSDSPFPPGGNAETGGGSATDSGADAGPDAGEAGGLPALPRRLPRTGEAPGGAPEPEAAASRSARATSAEELRSRLGGFQSGLRRAAAQTAVDAGAAGTGSGTGREAGAGHDPQGAEDAGPTPAEQHSTTPVEEEHG